MSDASNGYVPPRATVLVTVEGQPDAYRNGEAIELAITQPLSPVEATIVIPLAEAASWAAEVYVAVTVAYRDATGVDVELAPVPHSGRIITTRLTDDT
jgi:hypothetical protein